VRAASYDTVRAPAERIAGQDSRYAGRVLSVTPPNQNLLQGFSTLSVFDPVCNPYLRVLLKRTFTLENPAFALQPLVGANTIDERRMAVLRLVGVSVVYDHDVDASLNVERTPLHGAIVPDPLPRVWLLPGDDAFAARFETLSLERRVDELHTLIAAAPRIDGVRNVGNAIEFVPSENFRGRLVIQQAFTHAWRHDGESGRVFLQLFPSWNVDLKRGVPVRLTYEPAGLAASAWVALGGVVLLVVVAFAAFGPIGLLGAFRAFRPRAAS